MRDPELDFAYHKYRGNLPQCVGWLVSEMYFFEGGICITTLAHRADAPPPPPLLIRSRAHLFTTYLDVETYTLMSRYLMPRHNPLM
jgi:hypothetical protein